MNRVYHTGKSTQSSGFAESTTKERTVMSKRAFFITLALVVAMSLVAFEVLTASAQGPGGRGRWPGHGGMMGGQGMMQGGGMMGQSGMMGGQGMMGGNGYGYGPENCPFADPDNTYGGGMMGQGGMMGGNGYGYGPENCPFANPDTAYGDGMMGQGGMMGGQGMMQGSGMMWGQGGWNWTATGEAISLEDAVTAAEEFVARWNDPNLALGEVIQFDNHFYAKAVEVESGRGAFEFLINPYTGAAHPEPGPNMMWNLRYGMQSSAGGLETAAGQNGVEMTVTAEQAVEVAQAFLDANFPGQTAGEPEAFYGYYTLEVFQDGAIVGMLSVNGTTEQVWPHLWHGAFVAMAE
jgi:hypothetical protein